MLQIIIVSIIFIYTLVVFFVIMSTFWAFVRTRVPFVPSKDEDVYELIELAEIDEDDHFLDIGSGDGKVVFLINDETDAKATGMEMGLWMHMYANIVKFFKRADKVSFHRGDLFKKDWSGYTVLYAYLYPPLMGFVEEKFYSEGKPGARLVVKDFKLPGKQADKEIDIDSRHKLYLYEINS